jgi:membrane protease YdiL (CAAX protease family)
MAANPAGTSTRFPWWRGPRPASHLGGQAGPGLGAALATVAGTWALLALAPLLALVMKPGWALLASFGLCCGFAVARGPRAQWRACRSPRHWAPGLLLGWLLLPGLALAITWLGRVLGLPPPPAAHAPGGPAFFAATVVLAPVFEEWVYRGQLLPALASRAGRIAGLALSSAAFAIPHAETWPAFAAFWVGLLLGGLRCAGQALGLCMGVHAGLNLHLFFLARPC